MHATFNFTATVFGPLAYGVLFLVLVVYLVIIIASLAMERRAIRDELRDEVAAGTITSEEYAILPSYFRRTGYYLGLIFTGHLITWRRAQKVHGSSVDLALAKRLCRRAYSPLRGQRVEALRRKIADRRGAAPATVKP